VPVLRLGQRAGDSERGEEDVPLISITEGIAMTQSGIRITLAIALAISMAVPWTIAAEAEPDEEILGHVDPTKPVVFNVREEFSKLQGDNGRKAPHPEDGCHQAGGAAKLSPAL